MYFLPLFYKGVGVISRKPHIFWMKTSCGNKPLRIWLEFHLKLHASEVGNK